MQLRRTPIPSYYEILKYFQEQIRNGHFKPGDRLPTETKLMDSFGVSRITARKAMERLEFSKLITRKPGKGTFISEYAKTKRTLTLSGYINSIIEEAKLYDIMILDKLIAPANEKSIKFFGLSPGDFVCRIRRVRSKKRVPFSYVVNYLPLEIGNKISIEDLEKSTLLELFRKLGIIVVGGEETIEARNAFEISEILKIDPFDPVLYMEIVYRTDSGEVAEWVEHYYRGDYYQYRVNLV